MSHRTCVVFDLDDTLYMESSYVRSGFDAVGIWAKASVGLIGFAEAAWREHVAGNRGDIFNRVLEANGVQPTAELIGSMLRVYRTHAPQISLLPDADQCLRSLKGKAFLGVITDGPAESQRAKVTALNLQSVVDEIIITDELGRDYWKPHPRAFQTMQERSRVSAERCIYVGDNPDKDFIAARQLGWKTIRARRPGGLHCGNDGVAEKCADHEVTDLAQIAQVVLSL